MNGVVNEAGFAKILRKWKLNNYWGIFTIYFYLVNSVNLPDDKLIGEAFEKPTPRALRI
jgi:hypothetical protein